MDEEYALWCELHPCGDCEGTGEVLDGRGHEVTCGDCDGSGIDPDAVFDSCPCPDNFV